MGGYGAFVWSAWGLTAAVLVWLALGARRHHQRALEATRHAPARRASVQATVEEVK